MKKITHIPRVAALHDLSCFGRCALTVIHPIISAMGVQCIPVPTALLSTHTGGFNNMYFLELDESISKIADHFQDIKLTFDSIYTGFLGSAGQTMIINDFIDRFGYDNGRGEKPLVFVDPVLGDEGVLYHTCTNELIDAMRHLCSRADVISPNFTEACLLCNLNYDDESEKIKNGIDDYLLSLCKKLVDVCEKKLKIVLTGIPSEKGAVATATYDAFEGDGSYVLFSQKKIGGDYPGTGDIFASVMLGRLCYGYKLSDAAAEASEFVAHCVKVTGEVNDASARVRDGAAIELCLKDLIINGDY